MSEPITSLPGFVMADLYKNHLVLVEDLSPQPVNTLVKDTRSSATTPKKWYLGDNGRHIVIVVRDADAVYLNDESLQFLSTILAACKLNLGDVAIVNMYHGLQSFSFLKTNLQPSYALVFDLDLQQLQLPFTIPHYQVQQYDQCHFLCTPSLQSMLGNTKEAKLEKSKLWLSLKKMFNL